jgi:hypothetical protein
MVLEGRAIAFMGHPGAGKSTMAAWFHDRGHPVLADDVCAVTFTADGVPMAHPGIPRLRLWREALEAGGRETGDYELSFDDMDKYNVPIGQQVRESVPLHHVYVLEKAAEDAAEGGVRELTGVEAVDALVANTYRGAYLAPMRGTGQHLMTCVRLAKRIRVFAAARLWGYDRFDAQAEQLQAHASALIEGPA